MCFLQFGPFWPEGGNHALLHRERPGALRAYVEKKMTTGAAASSTGTASTTHHLDPCLTYTPRPLSRGQRSRQEVFVYHSPRNRRVVTVADGANFAMALLLEFDSSIRLYVERPRQIQLNPKTRIDLSFWSRTADGEDRFHLLVPAARTARSSSGAVMLPDREELLEVGSRNGVYLTFLDEAELMSRVSQVAAAYELLPLVWASERIATRAVIAQQVTAFLEIADRRGLADMVSVLPYPQAQTRATVAWLIHQGIVRLIDHSPGASDCVLELCRGE